MVYLNRGWQFRESRNMAGQQSQVFTDQVFYESLQIAIQGDDYRVVVVSGFVVFGAIVILKLLELLRSALFLQATPASANGAHKNVSSLPTARRVSVTAAR